MKKIILLFCLFISTNVFTQTIGPNLHFEIDSLNFGEINDGDTIYKKFHFVNNGSMPVLISQVWVTPKCGCTIPKYPTEPIKPGDKGFILISFDSKDWGTNNTINKQIIIINNGAEKIVTLSGIVNKKKF